MQVRGGLVLGHVGGMQWVPGTGVRAGYGTGVGIRVGYTGYYPSARKEVLDTAKRARKALQGPGVVVSRTGCVRALRPPTPDHKGPPGPASLSQASPRAKGASWPIRARLRSIL